MSLYKHQPTVYHSVILSVSVTSCHCRLSLAPAHQENKTKLMLLEHVKWMCSANPGLSNSLCLNLTRLWQQAGTITIPSQNQQDQMTRNQNSTGRQSHKRWKRNRASVSMGASESLTSTEGSRHSLRDQLQKDAKPVLWSYTYSRHYSKQTEKEYSS